MYASDYGFAASNSYWTSTLGSYNNTNVRNNNWMWMGLYEWTISRSSDTSNYAFIVPYTGYVYRNNVNDYNAVRPSFYLNSSVTYAGGTGEASNPIRVN